MNPPSYPGQQTWNSTTNTNPTVDSSGYNYSSGYGTKSGWGPSGNPPNISRQTMVNPGGQNSWQKASSSNVNAQPRFSNQTIHENRQSTAGPSTSGLLSNYSHNVPPPQVEYSPNVPPPKANSSNRQLLQKGTNSQQNFLDGPPPGPRDQPKFVLQQNPTSSLTSDRTTADRTTAGFSSHIPPPSFVTSNREEVIPKVQGWTKARFGSEPRFDGTSQQQPNHSNLPLAPTKLLPERGRKTLI